jgi:hypothetical protein
MDDVWVSLPAGWSGLLRMVASTPSRVKAAPLALRTFLLRKKAFGPLTRSYVKA